MLVALVALVFLGQEPAPAVEAVDEVCGAVSEEARTEARSRFEAAQEPLLAARWAEAEPPLAEALSLDPGHALAHYALGQAQIGLGRPSEAADSFRRSREAFRCLATADPERRARLERERADEIRSLRDTLRAFAGRRMHERRIDGQEANNRQPPPTEGGDMRVVQELEKRLEELERARRGADPAPPGVTLALGTALVQAGRLREAEPELRAAVAAEPKSGDAHNNLAVVLMLTNRLDEAESEARLARKCGVPVNPRLFEEIRRRREAPASPEPR
jgi:Tfp pilus assembly protein PilF